MAEWHRVEGRPVRSVVLGAARHGVPELVVVPGLGALGYLQPTLRQCAGWTRVTLLDVPGFGSWRTSWRPADLPTVARLVGSWLAQVPTAPVLLFGHSTGAQAALHAAVAQPDAVTALVLGGATFPPTARSLPEVTRRVARTLPAERSAELLAVLPEYVRGLVRLPQFLLTSLRDAPERQVPRLQVPLLVVHGEADRLCPAEWAQELASGAPHGEARALPGGHNHVFTAPTETSSALRSWGEAHLDVSA